MNLQIKSHEILRRKRIVQVQYVCLIALGLSILHRIYLNDFKNVAILGGAFLLLLSITYFIRRDNLDAAANVLVSSLSVLMLIMMWSNEGNRDEILLVFPAVICFAVLTGTDALFKYLIGFIILNVVLIAAADEMGWLEFSRPANSLLSATVILTILPIIAYVIRLLGSDLRNAYKEVIENQQTLETKVKERTRELELSVNDLVEARTQLAESEKMASLGRMVAGLSHEINTPIGIAVTAATHLQQSNDELRYSLEHSAIKKSQLVELLNNNVESARLLNTNLQRTSDLIRDFKDAAVIQSDDRKSQFSLNGHIERIVESLKPKLVDTKVHVKLVKGPDVRVKQDPQALIQIITNLFINSIKHGFDEGQNAGTICISTELNQDKVTVIFEDDGKGACEEVMSHIFEPFYTTKRGQGGSGLGMHIVYNLVTHSLNGTINCHSQAGQGIQFELSFDYVVQ